MGIYKEKNGFTVIETFIVIAIISLLLYMGGTISSKFALRRGIDDTANRITSELNLIKLQAARGRCTIQDNGYFHTWFFKKYPNN